MKRDGVSNHRCLYCFLFNRLFRCRSKKISKLRITALCEGNSPVTNGFPSQRASNAKSIYIWWRHHASTMRHIADWKVDIIKYSQVSDFQWFRIIFMKRMTAFKMTDDILRNIQALRIITRTSASSKVHVYAHISEFFHRLLETSRSHIIDISHDGAVNDDGVSEFSHLQLQFFGA